MKELEILIIGKHPDIMKTILRLLNNKPGWTGTGAFTVDEAIASRETKTFSMVLLGAGLSETEAEQVRLHFISIPVVQHYGGGSGLLYAEVYENIDGQ